MSAKGNPKDVNVTDIVACFDLSKSTFLNELDAASQD